MEGLNKRDLDYLVRTIMPELYEKKRAKDEYLEHMLETLPEYYDEGLAATVKLEEMRLSA